MNPLIIDDTIKKSIANLIKLAANNIYTYDDMYQISKNSETLNNDFNMQFTMKIPMEYNVTYTHEEHKKGVVCRHLSVSVDTEKKYPNPVAFKQLMVEFGFINSLENIIVYKEEFGKNRVAINVIEPLSGDFNEIKIDKRFLENERI